MVAAAPGVASIVSSILQVLRLAGGSFRRNSGDSGRDWMGRGFCEVQWREGRLMEWFGGSGKGPFYRRDEGIGRSPAVDHRGKVTGVLRHGRGRRTVGGLLAVLAVFVAQGMAA